VKLLYPVVGLWLALTAAVFGAGLAGRALPPPGGIVRLHLADCEPPCWIGITPGVSTVADAKAKILAAFAGLRIRDTAGFPGGYVSDTTVDNEITGLNFALTVRLTTSPPVDGRSETVRAVTLMTERDDHSGYAPTVEDILATFGAPDGMFIEESVNGLRDITLAYPGLQAAFTTRPGQPGFAQNPRLYLQPTDLAGTRTPAGTYFRWAGLGALLLRM
jgi:hypothetical protein